MRLITPLAKFAISLLAFCTNYESLDYLGSGGSSEGVYKVKLDNGASGIVKKGRVGDSVISLLRNECNTLHLLAAAGVENIEKCETLCPSATQNSIDIVLTPYFRGEGSIDSITVPSIQARQTATRKLMRTVAQCIISAKVASSDLQILVEPKTGDLLVIDFTEAKTWAGQVPDSLTVSQIRSFLSEAFSLIPVDCQEIAKKSLGDAVEELQLKHDGMEISVVKEMLSAS